MSQSITKVENSFVVANSENLKSLIPGCFVRVIYQSKNVWVEITRVNGEQLQGILQSESSVSGVQTAADTIVQLQATQINALGCDRYCYCD